MKNLKMMGLFFLTLVIVPMFLQSCLDNEEYPAEYFAFGTFHKTGEEGKQLYFSLDNGQKMYAENLRELNTKEWSDGQRVSLVFYKLEEPVPGYDMHIQVRRISDILTKSVVQIGEEGVTDETVGDDKINATYMWVDKEKKYLTIRYQYYETNDKDKKHSLNLLVSDKVASADNEFVGLEFRHNKMGGEPARPGEGYVSFRLDKLGDRMTGKKGLKIRVNTLYDGVKTYEVIFP